MPSGAHKSLNSTQSDKIANADKDSRDFNCAKMKVVKPICTKLDLESGKGVTKILTVGREVA